MDPIRLSVLGLVLCTILASGCARPAAPPPAEEEAPPPQPLVALNPVPPPPEPAPERPKLKHSPFFSKLGPAALDKLAAQCAPKDPKWKWLSVFSSLSVSSHPEPGEFHHVELGRYLQSNSENLARFLETLETEFEQMINTSGATVVRHGAFADTAASKGAVLDDYFAFEGFTLAFATDTTWGVARVIVSHHTHGYYRLVLRVEEAIW
jgi:hypothetical protein